jgi:hypothetical protein
MALDGLLIKVIPSTAHIHLKIMREVLERQVDSKSLLGHQAKILFRGRVKILLESYAFMYQLRFED